MILPSSTLKTSVESAPAKAGLCALKRSSACWDSVPGIEKVVGGLPAGSGRDAEQDEDDDCDREAALPVLGKRAGETREKLGHRGRQGSRVGPRPKLAIALQARAATSR